MKVTIAQLKSTLPRTRLAPIVRALGALGLAAAIVTSFVTDGPADPAARLEKARDLVFAREPEAALLETRKAIAELAEDGSPALRLKAIARAAQIADFHLGESRVAEALEYYRRLIKAFPASPEAFDAGVRVAEILRLRFNDDAHAQAQFVAVVDAFPQQAGVERLLLRAARIAIDRRRFEEARGIASRLLAQYGDSDLAPEAQHLLGTAFHLDGLHVDGVRELEKVAARWPRTEAAARALADAGDCLGEQGDYGVALARYIEALPEHPDPQAVQKRLERVRRRFTALREMKAGSKAFAFGGAPHSH